MSTEKAYDEVKGCSEWIARPGFTRDEAYKHFAYPQLIIGTTKFSTNKSYFGHRIIKFNC
jgi:hypothetical protein